MIGCRKVSSFDIFFPMTDIDIIPGYWLENWSGVILIRLVIKLYFCIFSQPSLIHSSHITHARTDAQKQTNRKNKDFVFIFIITHNCKVIVTIQISIIIISSRRVVRKAEIAPVWGRNTLKILGCNLQHTKFCPSLVWPCCQTLEGCGSKSCHSVMGPILTNFILLLCPPQI